MPKSLKKNNVDWSKKLTISLDFVGSMTLSQQNVANQSTGFQYGSKPPKIRYSVRNGRKCIY